MENLNIYDTLKNIIPTFRIIVLINNSIIRGSS